MLRASGRIIAAALLAATLSCGLTSCDKGPHILYGFLDDQGLWVITPQYTDALAPSEGLVPVQKDEVWGFVDSAGKVVIAPRFDAVLPFTEGLAAVRRQGTWSFIDPTGQVIVAGPFAEAHPFHGGLAAVEVDQRWGFVDHAGTLVIEPKLDEVGDDLQRDGAILHVPCFNEGRCAASLDGRWGFIDRSGAWVIPPRYKEAMGFREGRAAVREWSEDDTGKVGFVDRQGEWVIEPNFAASLWFSGGRAIALVERENVQAEPAPDEDEEQHYRAILIDTQGREVADLRWRDEVAAGAIELLPSLAPDYLAEGMIPASDGQHWGFMGRDGEWLIPPRFALVFPFKQGLAPAAVSHDPDADFLEFDGWGLIDHSGRWVAQPDLKAFGPYDRASIPAQLRERWGLLDRDGHWRVEPRYADAGDWLALPGTSMAMAEGLYRFGVYANHRWSAVDGRGRRSPVAEYEWLEAILGYPKPGDEGSRRLAYLQEGLWGLADKRLQSVVPAQFDASPQWSGRNGLLQVERAGKEGCIDASGRWVVPAEFAEIEECDRGEVRAKRDTGWGVVKPGSGWRPLTPGELPTSSEEDYSSWVYLLDAAWTWRPTGDDHFRLHHRGKLQGKVPAVDEVRSDHEESAATLERSAVSVVRRGEHWGALDARGKELLPVRFEAVGAIYDGRYAVKVGGKWGIVEGGGREVFPPVFEQAMPFNREVAIFCEGGHCGLVDKAGAVLLPPTYSGIEPLSASVATAFMLREDGTEHADELVSSGLVDAAGKVLVGQKYYSISTYSRHLLLAWDSGGRYHLLDGASGQPLPGLPELAGRPGKLSEGLAAVDLRQPDGGAAAGYIDARGKIVIEPVYDEESAGDFAGGIAVVSRDGRCGVIDRRGKTVLPLEYQHCQHLPDGRVLFAEEAPLRMTAAPGKPQAATPPAPGSPAP